MKKSFTLLFKILQHTESPQLPEVSIEDDFEDVRDYLDNVDYSPSQFTVNSILDYSKATTFFKTAVDDSAEVNLN